MSGSNGWRQNHQQNHQQNHPQNHQQNPGYGAGGGPPPDAQNQYNGFSYAAQQPLSQHGQPNGWPMNPQQQQNYSQMSHSSRSNSYHSQNSYNPPSQNYRTDQWTNNDSAYGNVARQAPYMASAPPQNDNSYNSPFNSFHLNVDAPTFVPRNQHGSFPHGYNNSAPSYGGGQRYGMEAQNFYQNRMPDASQNMVQQYEYEDPGQQDDYLYEQMYSVGAQEYVPSNDLQQQIQQCGQQAVITEIQIGYEQLLVDPNEFDSWAGAIKERILKPSMNKEAIKAALSIAIEMAISGGTEGIVPMNPTNPQYTFAKLFAFICSGKMDFIFDHLLPVIEAFHSNRSKLDGERSENFMMFTAELFEKVEMREKRIHPLGAALLEQITEIVTRPHAQITDQHLKKIVQIFKLAGRHLDAILPLKEELNGIMTRLSGFANGMQRLSESTKVLITSLIELREKGWGYVDRYDMGGDSGALIGPDGRQIVLSEEEQAFLDSHCNLDGDEGQEDGMASASEDPEMLADYEKYLKEVRAEETARSASNMLQKMKLITEHVTEENEEEIPEEEKATEETKTEEKDSSETKEESK